MHILRSATARTSLALIALAVISLLFADLEISTQNPGAEMARLFAGLLSPEWSMLDVVAEALMRTLAFALVGVALAAVGGLLLALAFRHWLVRSACASVRAVHELFWALIILQFFGLHPLTGILAIAIPYTGIFAKVYAEILDEVDPAAEQVLPSASGAVSVLLFARISQAWPHLRSYTSYRLECGLRSSAILGFVGMPTLGFYLESSFAQGQYSEVGILLITFYLLIASMRLWLRPKLIPLYLLAAPFLLGSGLPIVWGNVTRFFTEDIVPAPLRGESSDWLAMGPWLQDLLLSQALPGIINTLLLTQIALVLTGVMALLAYPLISKHFVSRLTGSGGHFLLVIARSTPEYLLAFILLQMWGPSMLPAVVALALHNAGIIGHLVGRRSNQLELRPDAASGINRYAYEVTPRIYGPFLALLFYRWEIIMRETAILGILGVATLGFYVDGAIQDLRFDRAMVLIAITAALNIGVDALARHLRRRLKLRTSPDDGGR